ncbi:hypothetical protein C3747_140g51 [Trypanosoma cruzi]|uniref:Uncharacterized protein n=2 Tax=Trypanosoma cruzi TaxID=5693 RepID=Q4D8G9_TRYCC|nr:hypothetical protein, conserved [Trypanosoma cruzi]EAN88820.1 hypothetical protein, conserved [Trypanosoma cruzi]PWV04974.1 hypothetical protein C3747_140g51 [Trypanosoma cruzi]|eukprot:XP_810671.1 hypothetical protein [Trypanosoma cruzi strain CL Brener]
MSTMDSSFVSHRQRVLDNRVERSMEGWSVIANITDFTHAVCRVSDGRGSAILVALPFLDSTARCDVIQDGRQSPQVRRDGTGVLLTTSFVFPSREEAQGATVTFLEQPVAGTNAREGRRVEPFQAPVNVEKLFFCSTPSASVLPRSRWGVGGAFMPVPNNTPFSGNCTATGGSLHASKFSFIGEEEEEENEEELGYTLTFCDMNPTEECSAPIGIVVPPLVPPGHSFISSSEVSASVSCVSLPQQLLQHRPAASYLERQEPQNATFFSSSCGTGSLTGRHATQRWDSYPIKPLPLPLLLSRIAKVRAGDRHLMITHINGRERHYVVQTVKRVGNDSCEYEFFDPASEFSSGGPIFDMRGDFVGLQHQSGDHSYGILISSIVRHLFQSSLLGVCRLPIVDVSVDEKKFDLDAVVPDEVFNQPFHINQRYCVLNVGAGDQLIEYEDFQRLRMRSDILGSTQPPSLVAPASDHVWKEFYRDFRSLILILFAFSHAPKVTKLALEEITSHDHRQNLPNVASLGGIGIVLEIIDGYPQNEEIVLAALTVLGRASLYKSNREAIFRCDGVLTVLEIMNEYSHHASIQHWGNYCLYNVMASDSPVRTESIELFAYSQGIAVAVEALRVHSAERYVLRHASFALSCVVKEDVQYIFGMIRGGLTNVIVDRMKDNSEDPFVFLGLATLLRELLCGLGKKNLLAPLTIPAVTIALDSGVWCDGIHLFGLDALNNRSSGEEVGNVLLDILVKEGVFTVLGKVMACESLNRYSSDSMTLLEACVGSVLVLLFCRLTELQAEFSSMKLKQTCEQILRNFPTEKGLLEMTTRIIDMLSAVS